MTPADNNWLSKLVPDLKSIGVAASDSPYLLDHIRALTNEHPHLRVVIFPVSSEQAATLAQLDPTLNIVQEGTYPSREAFLSLTVPDGIYRTSDEL